jgi:hypothetical protein
MQKIKLEKRKTILIKTNRFLGIDPNTGFNNSTNPVGSPNSTNESQQLEPQKLAVSFEEFEIKNFMDIPALKVVLAYLTETVSPLVLWKHEEYEQVGQWTEEQALAKANELLNSASEEDILKLYEPLNLFETIFGGNEKLKDLSEKIGKEEVRKLLSFIPMPNRPMLPKQG